MTVGDLEFSFTGDVSDLESSVDSAIEKVQDLADAVDRLDGKDIDIDADLSGAASKLRNAEEAADDLTSAVQNADGEDVTIDVADGELNTLQRRVQALDGRSIELETDVDRGALSRLAGPRTIDAPDASSTSRRSRIRLPGELDEVAETFSLISVVPPQIKALGAAAATAATALGAGAGLAGVATSLAAELGPAGLQRDVKAAGATFKEAGREFASAFSEVIRTEVLPAARGLAAAARASDDALASFSSFTIDFLKQLPGAGPAFSALVGTGRAQSSGRAGVLQGVGDVPGLRQIRKNLVNQIERVRGRFERDLIPKEELLSQIKGFRLDAVKNLQKLQQKFPDAFPASVLDAFAAKLKQVKRRLKEVRSVSLKGVAPQPADAEQVEGAGPDRLPTGGIGESIPDRVSAPSRAAAGVQRAKERVVAFRFQLQRALQSLNGIRQFGAQAFLQVGRAVGETIGKIVTLQTRVSSVGQAFQQIGRSIVGVIQSVITKLVSAIAAAAALAALTGGTSLSVGGLSGFSDFSGILGGVLGFAEGGIVTGSVFGVVGEGREDEAVMPLSRLSGFVQQAAEVGAASLTPSVPTTGNRFGGASVQTGSGGARLATGTIEVPVEVLSQGTDEGDRKRSRTGRRV